MVKSLDGASRDHIIGYWTLFYLKSIFQCRVIRALHFFVLQRISPVSNNSVGKKGTLCCLPFICTYSLKMYGRKLLKSKKFTFLGDSVDSCGVTFVRRHERLCILSTSMLSGMNYQKGSTWQFILEFDRKI